MIQLEDATIAQIMSLPFLLVFMLYNGSLEHLAEGSTLSHRTVDVGSGFAETSISMMQRWEAGSAQDCIGRFRGAAGVRDSGR